MTRYKIHGKKIISMVDIYRAQKAVADAQALFNKVCAEPEILEETLVKKAKTLRVAKEILLIANTLNFPMSVMYSTFSEPAMVQKVLAELSNVERENEM